MHFFHKNKSHPTISAPLEANSPAPGSTREQNHNDNNNNNNQKKTRKSDQVAVPSAPQQQFVAHSNQGSSVSLEQYHGHQQQQQQQQSRYANDQYNNSPYAQSSLTGSYGQLSDQSSRPVLNVVPVHNSAHADPNSVISVPQSPEGSASSDAQLRKTRRSFFGFHSKDKEKEKLKEKEKGKKSPNLSTGSKLGRRISVRRKSPSRKNDTVYPSADEQSAEQDYTRSQSRLDSHSLAASGSSANLESSSEHRSRPIQRVNTEPLEQLNFFPHQQQQQQHPPQYQQHLYQISGEQRSLDQLSLPTARSSLQVDLYQRPSSQQSFGAISPIPPSHQDIRRPPSQPGLSMAKNSTPEHPTGLRQAVDPHVQGQQQQYQPPGMAQGGSFKGLHQADGQDIPPQPPAKGDEQNNSGIHALVQKHEELQAKYIKVKRYYFEKEAQVQLLQNTVAHQRMSAVRTVFDDNEYATRFNRLDGAINNLAFNIRKDWKNVPAWLQGVVSEDAHTVGTKEMTAVGRAYITRLLVDDIFNRYFHPGLEPNLSRHLKSIEQNIRRFGNAATGEDRENQLDRLSFWRRTTLDGLEDMLQSQAATDNREQLTKFLVEKLTASLEMNLNTPPPPGLENSVAMIVELAVGIAANIPLESRDVTVEYFPPGTLVTESHMKVETALPPFAAPTSDPLLKADGSHDTASLLDPDGKDSSSSSTANSTANQSRKKSVFGTLMGKKTQNQSEPPRPSSQPQSIQSAKDTEAEQRAKENGGRIRFSAFVAVEVRGKNGFNVIVKAAVYPFASA